MKVSVFNNSEALGIAAAAYSAEILNKCIRDKGKARLLLSTGASQFDTIKALLEEKVDWSKVEMFHLDEYVGITEEHPASFRKYLKERFVSKISLKQVHFVNGEGNVSERIEALNREISKEPIDIGLIGVGENAHIAFNDPPADFNIEDPFIVVNLDEGCKKQQVGEGWFPTIDDVPKQAISMSVKQIMKCETIVSCIPYKVKAKAVKKMLEQEITNLIPATILKNHASVSVFLDEDSASAVDEDVLAQFA